MAYLCVNVWFLISCPSTSCGICIKTHVPPNDTADLSRWVIFSFDLKMEDRWSDVEPRIMYASVTGMTTFGCMWQRILSSYVWLVRSLFSWLWVGRLLGCHIVHFAFNLLVRKGKHPMLKDHKGSRFHHLTEWNLNKFEDLKTCQTWKARDLKMVILLSDIRHTDSILKKGPNVCLKLPLQIANQCLLQTSSFWTVWLLDLPARWSFRGSFLPDLQNTFSPRMTTETIAVNTKMHGNYCSSWR